MRSRPMAPACCRAARDKTVKLWDAATGALLRTFEGHSDAVTSVAFSPDGTRVLSGSWDTTVRIWSLQTGELLASMIGERDGEWLTITPKGFFAASRRGTEMLGVVRGLEPFSVMQFYDHLYRPDLIEQLLKGDPEGKYADAASKLNLEKILDSGSAPQIEQLPERKTELINDTAKVTVRLTDTGGGIGEKVVWRVNGVTQGELSASAAAGVHDGWRLSDRDANLAHRSCEEERDRDHRLQWRRAARHRALPHRDRQVRCDERRTPAHVRGGRRGQRLRQSQSGT